MNGNEDSLGQRLYEAAEANDLDEVRRLHAEGVDLNTRHIANNEYTRMLEDLTGRKRNLSPFALAEVVGNKSRPMLNFFLANGADISASGAWLHAAALNGWEYFAELLLAKGANVNGTDPDGKTAMHCAVSWAHPDMIRFLARNGASVNIADATGETPLHLAAGKGLMECVQMIIDLGGKVDAKEYSDLKTPLHVVCGSSGSFDEGCDYPGTIRILLEHGADVTAITRSGDAPLHCVSNSGRVELLEPLLEFTRDLEVVDSVGNTLLAMACLWGYKDMVQRLIDLGANINTTNANGISAVSWGSLHCEVLQCLIKAGVDLNPPGALHVASCHGKFESVKTLVAHGAIVNAKDEDGKTPEDLAKEAGHTEIADFLNAKLRES